MGNQLRAIRTSRKMSLRRLAELTGIDHSTIAKIERGQVRLASHHIDKMTPVLNCRPEDLVSDGPPLSDLDRELLATMTGAGDDFKRQVINLIRSLKT